MITRGAAAAEKPGLANPPPTTLLRPGQVATATPADWGPTKALYEATRTFRPAREQ